jgi:3-deoxy-D-manno-octulosonic-acid transferase
MVLIDWLVFALYRFLALPAAVGILNLVRQWLPAKLQEMIQDRSFQNLQALPARPIWIHASSGEIEYAKSVIRALKETFPQTPVLVTFFSPSAKKLIQKFPGIDLAMALPWDRRQDLEKFLSFYKPRACLIARTDVWPEMAYQIQKHQIPSILFSATLSSQSSRRGLMARSLNRLALNSLDLIYCVSLSDEENLRDLGVRIPIEINGDTRFDQVLHRLAHPHMVASHLAPTPGEKVFVCGSTWPQDEEILFDAWPFWISRGGRIIVAPHEVSAARLSQIENQLSKLGISAQRYSSAGPAWTSSVLIIDQIGILQEIYTWGTLAFVGGSFKDKVHSVMEPLCVGLPVLVGPCHLNNREALHFQHLVLGPGFFGVTPVRNANEMQTVMTQAWDRPSPHSAILSEVQKASGATRKLSAWLEQQIGQI